MSNWWLLLQKNILILLPVLAGRCRPPLLALVVGGIFCLGSPGLPGAWAAEPVYSGQQIVEMSRVLREKEQALAAREKLLAEKERRLQLLQQELEKKEREIAAMEKQAEKILAEIKRIKEEDLGRLVSVLATMKPAAAAPLVEKLEQQYAVEVILRLEPRKAGKILAAMNPDKAASLSRLITSLPAAAKE